MGKPNIQTGGGGSNTNTAQQWNNWMGGQLQGGGFNNLLNNQMNNAGLGQFQSFFNQQGQGGVGSVPTVGNPFQAPNYNTQGQSAQYNPAQMANTNFSNPNLMSGINNLMGMANHTYNPGTLGGLANMFMGIGPTGGGGGYSQQAAPVSKDQYGGTWSGSSYNSPWNASNRMPDPGSYSLDSSNPLYGSWQNYQNAGPSKTNLTPDQIQQTNQSRQGMGLPDSMLIQADGTDPYANPAASEYYNHLTNPNPPPQQAGGMGMGMGMGGGLPSTPMVGNDPNFMSFLSQGLGSSNQLGQGNFQAPQVNSPNLNVNSNYANQMTQSLQNDYQRNTLDLMNRMSASGGGLFGTPQAQMQSLLDRDALSGIGQATAQANATEGQFQQTANLANQQSALTSRDQFTNWLNQNRGMDISQLGLMSQNQTANRGLDVDQRNANLSSQTQQQLAGLNASIENQKLQLASQQQNGQLQLGALGLMNDSSNAMNNAYLQSIGLNQNAAGMANNFNLQNAQMNNNWMSGMNNLMYNTANTNAGYQQGADQFNVNSMFNNQQMMNNYGLGMGNIGSNLYGTYQNSQNQLMNNWFNSFQQSNQIGSPQAQTYYTPSTMSQIFNGIGSLGSFAAGMFGQNGAFPNMFGQGGGGMPYPGMQMPGISNTPSYPPMWGRPGGPQMPPVNVPTWGNGVVNYPSF